MICAGSSPVGGMTEADRCGRGQVLHQVGVAGDAVVEGVADAAYLVEQYAGVGRSQRGVACGGAGDQCVDVRRDPGRRGRGWRDVLVDVLVGHLDRALGLVRLVAGEHLVDQHPGGVHVGARVCVAVHHELGGEVGDGADQHATGGCVLGVGVDRAGQAEVGDLDPAVVGQQHVLGLDVAVQDAGGVRRGERAEHGLDHGERLRRRHRRFLADQVAQGQAGDVLHHQEERSVVVAGVEDGHHVLVGQPCCRTCLALEPAYELVVVGEPLVHHLDRHRAVQPQVDGLVDGGHPAAGDLRAHAVPAVEDAPDERVGSAVHGLLHAPGGEGTRLTSHFRGSERSDPGGGRRQ